MGCVLTFVRIYSSWCSYEKKYSQMIYIHTYIYICIYKSDDLNNVIRTHKNCDFCFAVKERLYMIRRKPLEWVRL
jgi:hypothetical protein